MVMVLSVLTATAQDIPAAQPYEDADAYAIYTLLLPKHDITIQENTVPAPLSVKGCLAPADVDKFRGAVVGYYRVYEKRLLLQRRFQLPETYRIADTKAISTRPDPRYFSLSPVGFNRARTQAIVYVQETCGRLCGSFRFHLLEKIRGEWKEVGVDTCPGFS